MKKSLISLIFLGIFMLLILPGVSAEISVSQPKSLYNLGDNFNFSVSVAKNVDSNDFLTASIVCDSKSVEIYRAPVSVVGGKDKKIDVDTKLDSSVLGNLKGTCYVSASYGGESVSGRNFEVSSEINVIVDFSGGEADPGSEVKVSGSAIKKNGKNVNGFAELSASEIGLNRVANVVDGKFEFNVSLPEDVSSGRYGVDIKIYERDSRSEITNEGSAQSSLQIKAVLSRIDIALNSVEIIPGEDVLYTILAYDQGGKEMSLEIGVNVKNPSKGSERTEIIKSGEIQNLKTNTTFAHGAWTLEAGYNEKSASKSFFVQELEKADFVLENGILIVKNVGNVPYSKPIGVNIGVEREVKDVFVEVGEEKRYRLNAPDGEYGIQVTTAEDSVDLGRVFLTGNSIAVKDNNGNKIFQKMPFVWILIIGLMGFLVYFYYGKFKTQSLMPVQAGSISLSNGDIGSGEKQKSSVVVVKIRNYDDVRSNENVKVMIQNILSISGKYNAKIMQYPDNIMFVLAPKATKKPENAKDAVQLANRINNVLTGFNERQKTQIDYGIGVNQGDLIVEIKDGKLKFSSVGSTVSTSKNLAENSMREVLISGKVHDVTRTNIKVEKKGDGWVVKEIKDNSKYHGFVENFRKSQNKDVEKRYQKNEIKKDNSDDEDFDLDSLNLK